MSETRAPVFWFTGLSGSGKTTVAAAIGERLEARGHEVLTLDGDDVRNELHVHLGFSAADITENNTLIVELCRRHRDEADAVLVPIISPFADSRRRAREALAPGFYEVYFRADLDTVRARDVKGLYTRASRGEIGDLIGVAPEVPYQPPRAADLIIDTMAESPAESVSRFLGFALERIEGRRAR